ncbi:MAG TPA: thioredoxin domain-containing protein [Microbacteriaceae bacterium]|nr:thioredoxin domain-containing protein [Microbacteriaceae bacterium]
MNNASTGGRSSKNERREQAREQARELREAARKKEKRNRILLQSGIIVGILAVAAVVVIIIVSSVRPASPGPQNMASDGLLIQAGGEVLRTPALQPGETPAPNPTPTSGDVIEIQTYVDYMCPYCGQFEATNASYLRTLVESGAASLEIFPLAFLDRASLGTAYPTRAMNAFGCVADQQPESSLRFNELLFENQPAESTAGLSDDEIVALAREAGAKSTTVETCIRDQQFKSWTKAATDRATQLRGVTATPTIYVNGQMYDGSLTDQATFRQFVAAAQGAQYVEDSAVTPTPTPTPSAG